MSIDARTSPVNPTRIPFTLFTSPVKSGRHSGTDSTLEKLHALVRVGEWADLLEPVRALAPFKKERDEDKPKKPRSARALEYSSLKESTLPYSVVSGTWDMQHRHADGHRHQGRFADGECPDNGPLAATGLRPLDLDDLDYEAQLAIKAKLDAGEIPWAAACWKSPGGDGLHLFAYLEPAPLTQADSHEAYAALLTDLTHLLPTAAVASDGQVKNLMRPSFVSHDPDARLYPNAQPFRWQDSDAPLLWNVPGQPAAPKPPKATPTPTPTPPGPTPPDNAPGLTEGGRIHLRHSLMSRAVPLDYNDWLGALVSIRKAGLSAADADAWCQTGPNYNPGEVQRKWGVLPAGTESIAEARNSILDGHGAFSSRPAGAEVPNDVAAPVADAETPQDGAGADIRVAMRPLPEPDYGYLTVHLADVPYHIGKVALANPRPRLPSILRPWEESIAQVLGTDYLKALDEPLELWTPGDPAPPAPGFAASPLMLDTNVSIIYGANGSGKSMLGLSVAFALASGKTVNGVKPVKPVSGVKSGKSGKSGKVLYLDAEDGVSTFNWRGQCMANAAGIEWGKDLPLKYHSTNKMLPDIEAGLTRVIKDECIEYIVADSLSKLMSDAIAQHVINAIFAVAARLGIPVLFISHSPKGAPGELYGGRAISGNARLVTCITTPDGEQGLHKQFWRATKANSIERPTDSTATWTVDGAAGEISATVEEGIADAGPAKGATVTEQRTRLILDLLAHGQPMTRPEIADALSLDVRAVRPIVTWLLEDGQLTSDGTRQGPVSLADKAGENSTTRQNP